MRLMEGHSLIEIRVGFYPDVEVCACQLFLRIHAMVGIETYAGQQDAAVLHFHRAYPHLEAPQCLQMRHPSCYTNDS